MASCTFLDQRPEKRNAIVIPDNQPPRLSQRLQERHARTQLYIRPLEKPPVQFSLKLPKNKRKCVRSTHRKRQNSSPGTIPVAKSNPWVLARLQKWHQSRPKSRCLRMWALSRSMFPTWKFQMPQLESQQQVAPLSGGCLESRKLCASLNWI